MPSQHPVRSRPGLIPAVTIMRAARGALAAACISVVACLEPHERTSADDVAAQRAAPVDGVATGVAPSGSDARFVHALGGFQGPESVRYDPDQDVFFISNMAGYGSVKDGNGFISRVNAANPTSATVFIQGGVGGVTLNAPKGIAIHGDTLWVTDIDVLRAFDRRTGAPLTSIDFAPLGAVQLNDIAVGPDGQLRVTDTGILMIPAGVKHVGGDRIFEIGAGQAITVIDSGAQLRLPNGITWDATAKRWLVVSFDPFIGEVTSGPAAQGDSARASIWRGRPRLDGIEVLEDGSMLFSSWGDSSVHQITRRGDRKQIVREIPEPADIGVDTRRQRVAIPLATLGQVQFWSVGKSGAEGSRSSLRPPPSAEKPSPQSERLDPRPGPAPPPPPANVPSERRPPPP